MLPEPLHPAVVHFPIALILFGTLIALISLIFRRGHIGWLAAILLLAGAAGASVAVFTGGEAADAAGDLPSAVNHILGEHADYGEHTRNSAIVAAVLALIGAATRSRTSKIFSILAVIAACYSSYNVAQAGKHGGMLVFEHGVGVKIQSPSPDVSFGSPTPPASPAPTP